MKMNSKMMFGRAGMRVALLTLCTADADCTSDSWRRTSGDRGRRRTCIGRGMRAIRPRWKTGSPDDDQAVEPDS